MTMVDYTKSTYFRDKNGNTFPCKFVGHKDRESFWVETLEDVVDAAGRKIMAGQRLLFRNSGVRRYGRGFVLIPPSNTEEQNTMKKAKFTSTDPVHTPTYWRHKAEGYVMWKAGSFWNRMYNDGHVDDRNRTSVNPKDYPNIFEPCYGDLVITISADT